VPTRLIIFDCDGVLFESEAANLAFYNEVLRRAGQGPVPALVEIACHTLASTDLYEQMFGDQPEVLSRVREVAQQVDYGPFYELMTPRPHLREILGGLRAHYRLAMATNRGRTAQGVLDRFRLEPYFELTVGALDVPRPKPHPDMLLRCLEHFGVEPSEAVYVGDQPTDAAAADAARVRFVAMGEAVDAARSRIVNLDELPLWLTRA